MIERVAVTGSTSADLLVRLAAGEAVPEGHWLVADQQTAGRGRLGRAWSDGTGNFMGSTVVHLGAALAGQPPAHTLALVAGLAVHAAVERFLPPPARALLKWPNDLMVGAAKLAGILLERVGDAVVVGVGVNLAQAPAIAGRETIACARFGPAPSRDAFAEALAQAFAAELGCWREWGLAPTIARWHGVAHPRGAPLTVAMSGQPPISGQFAGLDETGALRLALADGTTRIVHAGEVALA